MADEYLDPAANSVMVGHGGPGGSTDTNAAPGDPGGSTYPDMTPKPRAPTTNVMQSGVVSWLKALDEGAGFDTTEASGATPPDRSAYPWATTIGTAVNKVGGVLGGLASGLSFGLSDRLNAAVPTTAEQQNQRAQGKFETTQPAVNTAAQAVGAIPTAAIGEGALTRVIPVVSGFSNPIMRNAVETLAKAARGAIVGGAQGAGMDREDAVQGAMYGAGIGGGLPFGLGLLGMVGRSAVDAVGARVFPSLAEQQAKAKIAQAFNRDTTSVADIRQQLQMLGPQAGLIDTGGPNVTGLGESLANMPGQNRQIASSFLEGRMEGAPSRINDAIQAATGSPDNFHTSLSQTIAQRSASASPKYEAAFNRIVTTPEEAARVQPFISDPIGQSALNKGLRIIELEKLAAREPFNPADYGVTRGDDGTFTLAGDTPNLRLMDAVKRGYDVVVNENRNPTTQKLTEYGRAVNGARASYVSDLRDMYPRYGSALDAWSGPTRAMEALQNGRDVLSNDSEVTGDMIRQMPQNDRDFFLTGVARALKDKVDATQEGADATRKIFGNTLIRSKIASAFDDPAAFDQFRQTMENENTFATTRNEVLKGSQTARRTAAAGDVNYTAPITLLATGHPGPAALSVLQQSMKANPGVDTDPVKTAMARALFSQPGSQYFDALQSAQQKQLTPFFRVPAGATAVTAGVQPSEEQRRQRAGLLGLQ